MHEKGVKVQQGDEVRQFTARRQDPQQPRGRSPPPHHRQGRLQLLRAIVQKGKRTRHGAVAVHDDGRAAPTMPRAGGYVDGAPAPAWEPVLDRLLDDEGADEMRAEAVAVFEQHNLLASAFVKFGFEGSVGL